MIREPNGNSVAVGAACRESEVQVLLNRITKAQAELEEVLMFTAQKLHPVLKDEMPANPTTTRDRSPEVIPGTPLARSLSDQVGRLEMLVREARKLSDRIEV